MARTMTISQEVDVDVEISIDDVLNFIKYYASSSDKKQILNLSRLESLPEDRQLEGGMVREMKAELLRLAANKYSLEELEKKLGTKFDLL